LPKNELTPIISDTDYLLPKKGENWCQFFLLPKKRKLVSVLFVAEK